MKQSNFIAGIFLLAASCAWSQDQGLPAFQYSGLGDAARMELPAPPAAAAAPVGQTLERAVKEAELELNKLKKAQLTMYELINTRDLAAPKVDQWVELGDIDRRLSTRLKEARVGDGRDAAFGVYLILGQSDEFKRLRSLADGLDKGEAWGGAEVREGAESLQKSFVAIRAKLPKWYLPELKDDRLKEVWEKVCADNSAKLSKYEALYKEREINSMQFANLLDNLRSSVRLWEEYQASYGELHK